ncbi:uncharacterized protein N7500_008766 [Penicillium coprophilum]|uniref:uncharacterized protein n=1 Tax=Penicillium coprophilum TaxID=36646 RepID=UPI002390A109|nr:uncharacterized protein N7500_008766 [Penicillium coprophilum]KAJ5159115.1 hypothetical protein N7500_008766 [Penicillium coprophilum]
MENFNKQTALPDGSDSVLASICYCANLKLFEKEKPYYCNVPCPPGYAQTNQETERRSGIKFTDMRSDWDGFNLDKQGFEPFCFDAEGWKSDFSNDAAIETTYYPFVESLLKRRFGNVRVQIFDHTVRKRDPTIQTGAVGENINRQPSVCAHVDQTFLSGVNRIKLHMKAEATDLLKGRCQIIKVVIAELGINQQLNSVWKPLFEPLEDYPLALCDYRTVNIDRDLLAADLVFPHYVGEQFYCKYDPDHQWYFLNHQRMNEFLLFKCYESRENVARCKCCEPSDGLVAPHAAFKNPLCPEGARFRESIEVRCMIFYDTDA